MLSNLNSTLDSRRDEPSSSVACSRCILTSADVPDLERDLDGICYVCRNFEKRWGQHLARRTQREEALSEAVAEIQEVGKGKAYDCIIGISGGVDSSYLAWKVQQLGLRPLAVHFDNGWNSELAVQNIERITSKLNIDLHTYVVDWEEFRDLQRAYFKASVIDIEVPTDHGIYGVLYRTALKHDIRFILGGNNIATEGFMPRGWHYQKCDHINLRDIHRRFGTKPLKSYPIFDRKQKRKAFHKGIKILEFLDLIEFSRKEAVGVISNELGWRDYGTKHGESTFTKFYQNYVLPTKFGVDKRKAHLSTLIGTGELTREAALALLSRPAYSENELRQNKIYVLKKLGFSDDEFEKLMAAAPASHSAFETEGSLFFEHRWMLPFRPAWKMLRSTLKLQPVGMRRYCETR